MTRLLGEWQLNRPALNGVQPVGGPLTVSYTQNVDCRFDDVVLGPAVTAIDCSGADAAGGGSVGTAATANWHAFSNSMESTQYLLVARGTKLAIIDLSDGLNKADGTAEGAGAPYGEAVTCLLFTKNAAGTEEISVCFDNTIYRVITAIAGASYTASANNESHKYRIMGLGGSDGSAAIVVGLGRADGTPMNKVESNTLSGSTSMDGSSWQLRATIGGEDLTFTGFAMDGRFWEPGTSNGLYFVDGDGQRYRALQDEQPNDPDNTAGYGLQSVSFFGPAVFAPHTRSLRLVQGLNGRSVGVEMFKNNNSPIMGRYGWVGASELWAYLPIYNTITGDTYICAVRPRQDGDGHAQELSYFPIIWVDDLETKFCVFAEHKGGVTRPRMYAGRGSNMMRWDEGNLSRFPDDTGYTYATSGTLWGTRLTSQKKMRVDYVEFIPAGCSPTNTIAFEMLYVDHLGVENPVKMGGTVTKNGSGAGRIQMAPGGVFAHEIQPKFTFTGSGSTSTPRIKYGRLAVYGDFVDG